MNENEVFGCFNSEEQFMDVRQLFSLTGTQLLPSQCVLAHLSRVTQRQSGLLRRRGPEGGVGLHNWTTTPGENERTKMVEEQRGGRGVGGERQATL